jgi:hypothetical protein
MTAPIFETADQANARECEPGDFLVVVTPIRGVGYQQPSCFELAGCTVLSGPYPGSVDGEIARVYRRVAEGQGA